MARRLLGIGCESTRPDVVSSITAPGTPDTYRGDELWFFALVDPDNRRPVDYDDRERLLGELEKTIGLDGNRQLDAADPRLKLRILRRGLDSRRAHPELFGRGEYRPLEVRGELADHLIAFARSHDAEHAIVLAPRLLASVIGPEGRLPAWKDTHVVLPAELGGLHFRSALTNDEHRIAEAPLTLGVSAVLSKLPLALLLST